MAYKANPVQDFPDIELPIVTVSASLPGAAPAQLETEVARKIEDSVATLQGVKNIYTKVLDGVATVTVEFILEKNISDGVNEVRDAVSQVRADMPAELREPVVSKVSHATRDVGSSARSESRIVCASSVTGNSLSNSGSCFSATPSSAKKPIVFSVTPKASFRWRASTAFIAEISVFAARRRRIPHKYCTDQGNGAVP